MAGLDEYGYTIERAPEIREGMNEQMRAEFGPGIDVSDAAIEGVVIGIVSERIAEVWEATEAVNSSQDPDAATGARQDSLCALTGTQRNAATPSTATLTLTGDTGTLVPSGSTASVTDATTEFATNADATLVALVARANSTAYALGARHKHGDNAYEVVTAGTTAASGGPVGVDPTDAVGELDGTVRWRFMGEGEAAVDVAATATVTGPLFGVAGSIVNIETPVAGWSGVVNLTDAAVGTDIESHEDLRIRREVELSTPGSSPIDALRAEMLDVDGVSSVTVFMNNTNVTDGDGVPAKSVECLVIGGEDQDLWDQLQRSVAAGMGTHGTEEGTATDSSGNVWVQKFSRADELEMYATLTLVVVRGEFPEDGVDQIKAAIVAYGNAQRTGKDAVAWSVGTQASKVAGVLDVTSCFIGTAPSPASSATVAVSPRQLAVFDTSRIIINTSYGVP